MPYLPAVYPVFTQFLHQGALLILRDRYQQSSACLSSKSLEEFEVLNLVLNFYQIFVDRHLVNHEFNFLLLSLGQVVSMPKNAKTSHIRTSPSSVLPHKLSGNQTQSSHLLLSPKICLDQFRLSRIFQDLFPLLLVGLQPLHRIDRQSCPQWLGQHKCISRLGVVGHHVSIILNNSYRATSHHGPRVEHSLPSSHLSLGLLSCLCKSLDHQRGRHIFLELIHIGGNPQNHEHLLDGGDAHCVEVRKSIAASDSSKHIGRLDERVEEVKS